MADQVQVQWTDDALVERIDRAIAALEHPHALMQDIAAVLEHNVAQRFESKTDPTGQRWAPLAPSTRERYDAEDTRRSGPKAGQVARTGTLLERTRQMLSSLASNATDEYAEVGMTRQVQGRQTWEVPLLHEFGTEHMPRRGIVTADPATGRLGAGDEADVLAEVNAFLSRLL